VSDSTYESCFEVPTPYTSSLLVGEYLPSLLLVIPLHVAFFILSKELHMPHFKLLVKWLQLTEIIVMCSLGLLDHYEVYYIHLKLIWKVLFHC